ncbi:hypothetical protein SDC9_120447 [bioreactor metagenome]|uniref:TIGR04086 family membrane protein n=1 Tax=bioreactor metagenome TaxID=1076179 RepID=A0A645C818_9ZZZZ
MRNNEEEQGARVIRTLTHILIGGAAGLMVCLVFLVLCSFGISLGLISEGIMYQLTVIGCVIGGFFGGVWTVSHCRTRTLFIGLGVGAVLFLLMLTAGVLFFKSVAPNEGGLGLVCGSLSGGAVSGLLGGRPKKKRR